MPLDHLEPAADRVVGCVVVREVAQRLRRAAEQLHRQLGEPERRGPLLRLERELGGGDAVRGDVEADREQRLGPAALGGIVEALEGEAGVAHRPVARVHVGGLRGRAARGGGGPRRVAERVEVEEELRGVRVAALLERPEGERVQLLALREGQGVVRDLALERVGEPEPLRAVGPEEPRLGQRAQRRLDRLGAEPGTDPLEHRAVEGLAAHRRELQHPPLDRLEPVEANPDRLLDRPRELVALAVLRERLEEERVAAAASREREEPQRVQPRRVQLEQPHRLVLVERRELDALAGRGHRDRSARPRARQHHRAGGRRHREDVAPERHVVGLGEVQVLEQERDRRAPPTQARPDRVDERGAIGAGRLPERLRDLGERRERPRSAEVSRAHHRRALAA